MHPRKMMRLLLAAIVALSATVAVQSHSGSATLQTLADRSRGGADDAAAAAPKPLGADASGNSTLVAVQVVSRHGTRAPNPVVDQLCPADRANLALYADLRITLAGLTGTGMRELYALGVFARQQYITRTYPGFLDSFFNDQQVYFRAVGEDRTLQSAAAMAQGMYPRGTAPLGYSTHQPSPVPVYTIPDAYDNLLEVRKQGCKEQLAADGAAWDATKGIELYKRHQDLLARMHALCNITDLNDVIKGSGDNYGDAIKDITDAWTFDMIEGFNMQDGLNTSSLLEFRTMAVEQLLGRIVGTDKQVTYMNGELPERMLDNFLFSVWNQGPPAEAVAPFALKMYAYHGHREMIYALAAFLGFEFNIEFPALPKGAIPPATTIFFELHYDGPRDANSPNGIPNPFDAAGQPNPYAKEAGKGADALGGRPLPWERQLRYPKGPPIVVKKGPATKTQSASKTIKDQPIIHHHQGEVDGAEGESSAASTDESADDNGAVSSVTVEQKVFPVPAVPTALAAVDPASEFPYLPRAFSEAQEPSAGLATTPHKAKEAPAWQPAPPTQGYFVKALLWHPCADENKDGSNTPSTDKDFHETADDSDSSDPSISGQDDSSPSQKKKAAKAAKALRKSERHRAKHRPDCPAVPIAMTAVCDRPAAQGCTLQQFQDAIHKRLTRTGTWDKLCGAKDVKRIMADVAGVAQAAKDAEVAEQAAPASAPAPASASVSASAKQPTEAEEEFKVAAVIKPAAATKAETAAPAAAADAPAAATPASTADSSLVSEAMASVLATEQSVEREGRSLLRWFLLLVLISPLLGVAYLTWRNMQESKHEYQSLSGSSSTSAAAPSVVEFQDIERSGRGGVRTGVY